MRYVTCIILLSTITILSGCGKMIPTAKVEKSEKVGTSQQVPTVKAQALPQPTTTNTDTIPETPFKAEPAIIEEPKPPTNLLPELQETITSLKEQISQLKQDIAANKDQQAAQDYWKDWTGAIIHVSDVEAFLKGTRSDCPPCDRLSEALDNHAEWKVGEGREVHFHVQKAGPKQPKPTIEYIYKGKTQSTVVGFNLPIKTLLEMHPLSQGSAAKRKSVDSPKTTTFVRPLRWRYYGDKTLAQHVVEDHGYSWNQVAGLNHQQLVDLHSFAHNNRITQGSTRRVLSDTLYQTPQTVFSGNT